MADRDSGAPRPAPIRLLLASSNAGKLREYRELAGDREFDLDLLPGFQKIVPFEESGETFAENAVGKALYYGRLTEELLIAEDSGLVVPALGGAPGVYSARYAGPEGSEADCVQKLLRAMDGKMGSERSARFVCVIALALRGRVLAVVSDLVDGTIADQPRGEHGFGYDPVFMLPDLGRTSGEISSVEKNRRSHRGKAFRKIRDILTNPF
ncbi:MAG TPA: RdgB/HAM1 family non-canonical purine NTP pyrophosphatase [Candidatus Acidoferrales bacterium]|nr:RdgB/HAM1 family non-canonical purine NTP pyrophosphatase [Candidatus Acidoferrales bacterium]